MEVQTEASDGLQAAAMAGCCRSTQLPRCLRRRNSTSHQLEQGVQLTSQDVPVFCGMLRCIGRALPAVEACPQVPSMESDSATFLLSAMSVVLETSNEWLPGSLPDLPLVVAQQLINPAAPPRASVNVPSENSVEAQAAAAIECIAVALGIMALQQLREGSCLEQPAQWRVAGGPGASAMQRLLRLPPRRSLLHLQHPSSLRYQRQCHRSHSRSGSHDRCVLSPLLGGRTVTGSSLHEATSKKQK